eukprot:9229841-Pyramimonas_sp.AAC.2
MGEAVAAPSVNCLGGAGGGGKPARCQLHVASSAPPSMIRLCISRRAFSPRERGMRAPLASRRQAAHGARAPAHPGPRPRRSNGVATASRGGCNPRAHC